MDNKKAITKPVIHAAIVLAVFYVIEIVLVYLNVFPDYNMLLCADVALRTVFGIVSLVILAGYSKRGESRFAVKKLFSNRIPAGTWLVLIPFILYIIAPFIKLVTAYGYIKEMKAAIIIIFIQQFATGFFEESLHRGLMMNGLLKHNTNTVKQRIFTVIIAGAFFGLSHALNIFFGENPLAQVPSCILWGMFIAAVYMLSDNLLLVMLLHAFSDLTFRIVDYLFAYVPEAPVCQVIEVARDVMDYAVLPVTAILICIFYDRLKGKTPASGENLSF